MEVTEFYRIIGHFIGFQGLDCIPRNFEIFISLNCHFEEKSQK